MANKQEGPQTMTAVQALSIYRGVKLAAGGADVPAADGPIIGITLGKQATIGKAISVECRPGIRCIVEGGDAWVRGDRLKVNAAGKFLKCVGTDVADGKAVAIAWDACTGDGKRGSATLLGPK